MIQYLCMTWIRLMASTETLVIMRASKWLVMPAAGSKWTDIFKTAQLKVYDLYVFIQIRHSPRSVGRWPGGSNAQQCTIPCAARWTGTIWKEEEKKIPSYPKRNRTSARIIRDRNPCRSRPLRLSLHMKHRICHRTVSIWWQYCRAIIYVSEPLSRPTPARASPKCRWKKNGCYRERRWLADNYREHRRLHSARQASITLPIEWKMIGWRNDFVGEHASRPHSAQSFAIQ